MSLTVKNDDVTRHRRDVDPHGRLRAVTGGSGTNGYTVLLVLSFNVLAHLGRDTPSIDLIWRMCGSLSSKRSLLDRFRPGGYFSDAP